MQVFKTFMKIIKTKPAIFIMYIGIFLGINVGMVKAMQNNDGMYVSTTLKICVIDEDKSAESKALTDYIGSIHKIVDINTDEDSVLDALYYRKINYVLTIKKGYGEKLGKGEKNNLFENKTVPGVYSSELFDSQLDNYVNVVSSYLETGNDINSALEKSEKSLSQKVDVNINTFSDYKGDGYKEGVYYYMQYLPYIFISLLVSALCPAVYVMMKKDIRNRTNCSAYSSSKQTFQIMLGVGIVSLVVWLIFMIACGILYGFSFLNEKGMYAVLNSFVFLLISVGISLVTAFLGAKDSVVSLVANVVGLGMSFLCGIFVPQSILGDGIVSASKFLPAYWYVKANDMLAGKSQEIFTANKFMSYIGVEMLFVIALFSAVILIAKLKVKEK